MRCAQCMASHFCQACGEAALLCPFFAPQQLMSLYVRTPATCPITLDPVVEPVRLLGEQVAYERAALERWVQDHGTSPLTRKSVRKDDIVPHVMTLPSVPPTPCHFCNTVPSSPVDMCANCGFSFACAPIVSTGYVWRSTDLLTVRRYEHKPSSTIFLCMCVCNPFSDPVNVVVSTCRELTSGMNCYLPERLYVSLGPLEKKPVFVSMLADCELNAVTRRSAFSAAVYKPPRPDRPLRPPMSLNVFWAHAWKVGDFLNCTTFPLSGGAPAVVLDCNANRTSFCIRMLSSGRVEHNVRCAQLGPAVIARQVVCCCRRPGAAPKLRCVNSIWGLDGEVSLHMYHDLTCNVQKVWVDDSPSLWMRECFRGTDVEPLWRYNGRFGIPSVLPSSDTYLDDAVLDGTWAPCVRDCLQACGLVVDRDALARLADDAAFSHAMESYLACTGAPVAVHNLTELGVSLSSYLASTPAAAVCVTFAPIEAASSPDLVVSSNFVRVAAVFTNRTTWRRVDDDHVCCTALGPAPDVAFDDKHKTVAFMYNKVLL